MKRLQSPSGNAAASLSPKHSLDKPTHQVHLPDSLDVAVGRVQTETTLTPQAVFSPLHYESGYAYPLVVWLHGPGDDERQLRRIMPLVSLRNYVAVAPRGTSPDGQTKHVGFAWEQTEDQIEEATNRVFDSVAFVENRFHIASSRIFLAGFQCGGTMAIRLALHNPERFAGAITIGGAFPTGHCPLRNVVSSKQTSFLLATGRESNLYSETQFCRDLQLAHTAGLCISARQYPCGDELMSTMLSDADAWIMEQVCGGGA